MAFKITKTVLQRFEEKYIPEPNSGCWLWIGAAGKSGGRENFLYGRFWVIELNGNCTAHRASWFMHNGPIPTGMGVLHRCDVTLCVNPDHLFLGTNSDNQIDCFRKGRSNKPCGEKNTATKLTTIQVTAIRQLKKSMAAIAREYGVSKTAIRAIKTRHTWKHVP